MNAAAIDAPVLSSAQVWSWLAEVSDPEIPVISIVDLGIVRDVRIDDDGGCTVTIYVNSFAFIADCGWCQDRSETSAQ